MRILKSAGPVTTLIVFAVLFDIGCGGGGSASSGSGAPSDPPPSGQQNSYVGTQGTDPSTGDSGAVWQISINHATNSFSSADYAAQLVTTNGLFTFDGGFLDFSETSTSGTGSVYQPDGFTFEIPGNLALYRPGFNSNASGVPTAASSPVISVPGNCLSLTSTTFQFVTLPTTKWAASADPAYGSIRASANGNTWTFSGLNQFKLDRSSLGQVLFKPGTCAQAAVGTVVSVPPASPAKDAFTLVVGPSGFFIMNEGPNEPGAVGLAQPSGALNTRKLAAATYLGFISEPNLPLPQSGAPTANVIGNFGCPISGCTASSLVGGAFPNDDPTQIASTNITINLGAENGSNPGLYDSATLTIPDTAGSPGTCSSPGIPGTDSQGNPTCTVPAAVVAGNPNGKFAIFLIAQDMVNSFNNGPMPLTIYLLQE